MTAPSGRALGSERTVLYVEDNRMNIRLVEVLVARLPGIRLVAASTGSEGLAAARAECPDLILLDVRLPDMCGEEVLKTLARDGALARIPVIVVTADRDGELRERLLANGACRVIAKPFDVSTLKLVLEAELSPQLASPEAVDQRAVESLRAIPNAAHLIADFIEEGRRLVGGMDRAAAGHDTPALADLSHRLAGTAGTFGAPGLGRMCAAIERAARSGNLPEASRLIAAVVEEFELVAAELPAAFA